MVILLSYKTPSPSILTCLGRDAVLREPTGEQVLRLTKSPMASMLHRFLSPIESFLEGCKCNAAACLEWSVPTRKKVTPLKIMVNLCPDKSNLFQNKRVAFCNFIFTIVEKHKCRIYSFDISWYPISPYIITSESYITLMRISELITNQRSAGLFNKFFLSVL